MVKRLFHAPELSSIVEDAAHAVAIDEHYHQVTKRRPSGIPPPKLDRRLSGVHLHSFD
jgi:hypothetical protein